MNALIRNVSEIDIATRIHDRPFGERETVGDQHRPLPDVKHTRVRAGRSQAQHHARKKYKRFHRAIW
jgi:hypothetical protein